MRFQTMLEADVPRMQCRERAVAQVTVSWAEAGSRFTSMFEALVIDWMKIASISAVSIHLRLSWNAVDGIMQWGVKQGLARREERRPTRLAVDEGSFQRHQEYGTVVTDQETGAMNMWPASIGAV